MKTIFRKKNSLRKGAKLSIEQLEIGMIVMDGFTERFVTKVEGNKVFLTGKTPMNKSNKNKTFVFNGWYSGKLKEIKKYNTFQFDGYIFIKGDYNRKLKKYECIMRNFNEVKHLGGETIVTI